MFTVSNKIKFCTCKTENVEQLKHYWKLHQKVRKDNYMTILGTTICPTSMRDKNYKENNQTLENRLNESGAFDFETSFKNGDVIVIQCENDYLTAFQYTFKFKNKKWEKYEKADFELKYQAIDGGIVTSPLNLNEK